MATAPASDEKVSSLRRVVTASMAGTVVEWYEFFLYATAATLVFGPIMFLGYQVTSIFAGSLAPIIATAILSATGSWVGVAFYLAAAAAITLVAVISLRETKGISLHEIDRVDRERLKAETESVRVPAGR